jgi:hypothetical protein
MIQDSRFKIQKFKIQDSKIQDSRFKIQDSSALGGQDSRFKGLSIVDPPVQSDKFVDGLTRLCSRTSLLKI